MILVDDIIFGEAQRLAYSKNSIYLEVLDVTKSKSTYLNKTIFVIKIFMDFSSIEGRSKSYSKEKNQNILTMLLIGDDDTEYGLLQKLNSGKISLRELSSKMNYDHLSQVDDEETYRYINKNMSSEISIAFLSLIKDMGTIYNIRKSSGIIKRYSNKIFFNLLMHNTSSRYAFENGYKHLRSEGGIIFQTQPPEHLTILSSENEKYKLHFSNRENIRIPLHVLIGKNGSGKTYLLRRIVKDYLTFGHEVYYKGEVFSRIIALSNTINDECYRPQKITRNKSKTNNYHFVSLTSKKYFNNFFPRGRKLTLLSLMEIIKDRDLTKEGFFKQSELLDRVTETIIPGFSIGIKTNLTEIRSPSFSSLIDRYSLVNLNGNLDLISGAEIEYILPLGEIVFYKNNDIFELSSGQIAFMSCMFSLISIVESNSLVIIEEPENYLHPSLLTHFINSITNILRDTNSVAIISTHSALVLREIPSIQVTILNRNGNVTKFKKPNIETFGADTHQIMIDIFGDLHSNAIFREEISKIAENKSISEILGNYSHLSSELINKIIMEVKSR
ncbi:MULTISPECIES: AAA family ATPase [Serratia]|uniref:AAA family ATPase n=1 Tax=Serratia TaxID=613 RepID=UPI001F47FC5D|nr:MULTISPECIES: AAA family ATPase [Serratia]MCE9940711.1 ATP-binding protein [Serratia liquefaciens]